MDECKTYDVEVSAIYTGKVRVYARNEEDAHKLTRERLEGSNQPHLAFSDWVPSLPPAEEVDPDLSSEHLLGKEYPIFVGFWYVVDGVPWCSGIKGTVADVQKLFRTDNVRWCDVSARGIY